MKNLILCFILFFTSLGLKASSLNQVDSLKLQIKEKKEIYDQLKLIKENYLMKKIEKEDPFFYKQEDYYEKIIFYGIIGLFSPILFSAEPGMMEAQGITYKTDKKLRVHHKIFNWLRARKFTLGFLSLVIFFRESSDSNKQRNFNEFERLLNAYKASANEEEKKEIKDLLLGSENYDKFIKSNLFYFKDIRAFDDLVDTLKNSIKEDEKDLSYLLKKSNL